MTTIARNYITIANIEDGKQGKPGEGGLSVMAIPSHLTFDTDQNGTILLTNNNANKARIVVFEGLKSVNPESITLKPYNCQASHNGDTITINSIDQGQANGQVEVAATYKGNTYTTALTFYVSKQRWNDAEFTTIKGKFESIQEEFERVDGEITDTKSTINQLPEKITLEVLRHENGINMLKGASLLYPTITIDGKEHNILAGATIEQGALSHNGKPYLQVNKSQYTSNEYDGARFAAKVKANKTYTLSMYYRVVRSADQGFHLAPELKDKYNGTTKTYYHYNKTILQNNQWQRYENTFTINQDGYLHFNPSVKRNGWIVFSEIQLEEGNKATPWTNPDKDERFRRAGIDLELERIILQADKVYIRNSKGEQTAAIDQDGNLIAGTLRTKDNGGGYIYLHDNLQEYYKHGANHPSRRIGYIGNDWVDQRLSDDGNVIWEMNERGIVHYQTPERWVHVSNTYITTIENIKKFFLINQRRTLDLIFNSSNHKSATLKEYVAARDVNGNIISSAGVTVEEGQANDGKLFYTSQYNGGLSLGDRFELDNNKFSSPFTGLILATEPMHYYPFNNQSGQTAIPPEYTKFRQLYGVEDYYNVDFNRPVEWAYVNIYHLGRRIGSHRMFRNK